jgi:cyclopropane fatty-acyl-phospholipid synthase-like methyltransferase
MSGQRYRERIYRHYVAAHQDGALVIDAASLAPRSAYLRDLIARHFPPDREAAIIDLGCGHGTLLQQAAQAGYRNLRGVDASPQQVAMAARLGIAGVDQGDLTAALAALADGSQAAVISFDVIEHFTKDETVDFVDQVLRVLRPGGRWIIHVPNGESPFGGRSRFGDFTHEQAFTRGSLTQLLLASGFATVACYEDAPIAHGARSRLRALLWRPLRLALRLYLAIETGDTGRNAIFTQNLLAVAVK